MTYIDLTLCVISKGKKILLGMKKRGFGKGNFNGFGGKIHAGESPLAAAMRECEEEAHIQLMNPVSCGELFFSFEEQRERLHVYLYRATEYTGTPEETEEMRPEWFSKDAIPYDRMWADDVHWLSIVLAGGTVRGHFHFTQDYGLLWLELHKLPVPFMV